MPRVGDLSKCKIYKITSLNNPELVYYGHTCQALSQRFASHKGVYNTSKSKVIIEKGDAVIILIENYPCETEEQASAREAFYILNNPCINKVIPGRSKRQYEIDNKDKIREYKKQYKIDNADKIREYKKQHYIENKEKIIEQNKQHYIENKEKILERIKKTNKQWYESNKENILERKKLRYQKQKLLKSQLLNNETQTNIESL